MLPVNKCAQVAGVDSRGAAVAPSSSSWVEASLRKASCDLLSHTLLPHAHGPRARFQLSDRKLSLQERSPTAPAPCDPPGAAGRYIYPSLPYSPVTSPHTSPRLPRRPTVESHSVSITDLQVAEERRVSVGFVASRLLVSGLLILSAPLLSVLRFSSSSTNVGAVERR